MGEKIMSTARPPSARRRPAATAGVTFTARPVALAVALLLGAAAPSASAAAYTIKDLATLGGTYSQSSSYGTVNASGQVAGTSATAGGQQRAFRTAANAAINPATDDVGTL